MTDRKETKLEFKLTRSHKSDLVSYIKTHKNHFPELIKLAISEKQPYSWRAAWLLWSCIGKNDYRIRKHIKKIIEVLPNRQDNQQRELLLVLQRMELNLENELRLFDLCFKIWNTTVKNPSLRYNALKTMILISRKHPDLASEMKYCTDPPYIDNLTAHLKKSILQLTASNHGQ